MTLTTLFISQLQLSMTASHGEKGL